MSKKPGASLWTGTFLLLIAMSLFNYVAGQMTIPLVAKFAFALKPDLTLASTVAGLMSLTSLFVCPFAGVLADRLNKKKILIFSIAGYGLALLAHSLATDVTTLIVLRLLTGLFFSINSVTLMSFSSTFIPRERLGEGMGYIALSAILAQAIGPAIGLELVDWAGYQVSFGVAGVVGLVAVVLILPLKYEHTPVANPRKSIRFSDVFAVEFMSFMLLALLFSSGNGMVSTYLALLADEREIANISLFFTLYSVCMVLLRPLSGKLLDKKGIYVILIPSVISAALGMVFIGIGSTLGIMLAAAVFKAVGQGTGTPSVQAYAVKALDKSRSGVAVSTIQIGQNVGNAIAPIIGSFFVKSFGYRDMFVGYGGILLVGGFLVTLWQYKREHRA